jgi:hypothetical protein
MSEVATRLPWLGRNARVGDGMSPLALHFLRRVSAAAVLAALAIAAWTRGAGELGFDAHDRVAQAESAIAVARDYGADGSIKAFVDAERDLKTARQLLAQGDRRPAGQVAARAEAHAHEAQRAVIVEQENLRHRSQEIVDDVDRQLNELEDLFDDAVRAAPPARASAMLTRMKQTRAAGAAIILAHEQKDFRKVVREHAAALAILAETKQAFASGA